jgi:pimeloyl-ACP methyl ester carboxylesterase
MGKEMRLKKIILFGCVLVTLLGVTGFITWASFPSQPMPEALAALINDDRVIVEDQTWLVFRPTSFETGTGLIFYPGGRVDARAYAPMARATAEAGYMVVIVPMPLNLAVFGSSRAKEIMDAYPQVGQWAIGGHSLGGAMAARFVHRNPSSIQGLVLVASYPASSDDLSAYDLEVLSIFGTRDQVMADGSIESSRALLPQDTEWVPIQGGNHAQFGWYGNQAGDGQATISYREQNEALVLAIIQFLEELK